MSGSMLNPESRSAPVRGPRVRMLTDWTRFEELHDPWNELVGASGGSVFVSHEWLSIWNKAFGGESAPRVVQVWADGQLVAAAPLCLTYHPLGRLPLRSKIPCLSMMSNHETPFSQLLVAPGHHDTVEKILCAAADKSVGGEMYEFEPIREDGTVEVLRESASLLGLPSTWCETTRSVTLDVSKGWETYLADCSMNFRRKIRRERRALERVEHKWTRGANGDPGLFERAFAVSVKSWKGRSGTSIGSTERVRAFYSGLWDTFGKGGVMEVTLLGIGGADAGSFIALRHRDVAYAMKTDFVEKFSEYSPGRMMVADFVERSARQGLREVDMLRRSQFTNEFSRDGYALGRLRMFPRRNAAALWYAFEELLRPIGREWRRRRRRARRGRGVHKR